MPDSVAAAEPSYALKSTQFRREREAAWNELELLLGKIDRFGLGGLNDEQIARLPILYRGAVSSLSVARAISLDKALLDYLETLVARAYLRVYSNQRYLLQVVGEFFVRGFPGAVYRFRGHLLTAALLVGLGFFCAFAVTISDMERYHSFVPEQLGGGRSPSTSTDDLRKVLYTEHQTAHGLTVFAVFLFTHNAGIAITAFALGVAAGVPCGALMFYNGLSLGAMTALYASRGMQWDFLAWVAGHGVTELLAIFIAGAGGFALAEAMLFPGRRTRIGKLAEYGRICAPLIVGAVVMLMGAAFIEGYVRQMLPYMEIRWGLALVTGAFWAWYFFAVGGAAAKAAPVANGRAEAARWN